MGHFNKFDKGRGGFDRDRDGRGGSFRDGGRGFNRGSDGPKQMHHATCSECGQDCEVPFRPTGDRPVFCSNCFKSKGAPARSFAPKSFDRGDRGGSFRGGNTDSGVSKAQIDLLNAKLDKILSLLTGAKVEAPKVEAVEVKSKKEIVKKEKTSAKKSKGKKK